MGIITNHDIRIPFLTNQAFYDEKYDPENGHYVVGLQFHPAARLEVVSRLCHQKPPQRTSVKWMENIGKYHFLRQLTVAGFRGFQLIEINSNGCLEMVDGNGGCPSIFHHFPVLKIWGTIVQLQLKCCNL